jgi:ribose transport system ATP-binding protein
VDVRLLGITQQFPGTRALSDVTVTLRTDEVHGIIGENGAGKSTLVSVLGGSLQPTAGTVEIGGAPIALASPRDALVRGIAHVSQEGSLVPALTGAENILLGDEPRRAGGVIRRRALRERAAALVARWFPEVAIDLARPVGELPMADQKIIEIVRALRGDVVLVILDEPTATLPAREKEQLWGIIRSLPAQGVGVVLISHFLSEIKALSDRITVLRDGRLVCTEEAGKIDEGQLVDMMLRRTGGATSARAEAQVRDRGPVALAVRDWRVGGVHVPAFSIRAGEIVGLVGLTASGHFGFARSLYNGAGVTCAAFEVAGRSIRPGGPRSMQQAGIALVPDHRMENALIAEWDLRENLGLVHAEHAATGGVLFRRREEEESLRVMRLLNVKAHSSGQLLRTLSGGNKQKISIGKWLYGADGRYRVMIFIEPTEGVDIGAKAEIYAEMRRLAAAGTAILIASSDLLEIETIADRAVPFVSLAPGAEIPRTRFSEATFIAAISGAAA